MRIHSSDSEGLGASQPAARRGDNARSGIELWGGIECTVVRIGNEFRNQVIETGHNARLSDLQLIADLGMRTLRYPLVWETVCPESPEKPNWIWHDERLKQLRLLGIAPIAGLVHHGSGPAYTSLLDPEFPRLLADYAVRVAKRFPWIEHFTPVNEPLTTARFSGLYGHWYPHAKDKASFLRCLVNQCAAVAAAMRAIRGMNPRAKLVQTEDLGKTFSTPLLTYQADFENERRWLSLDLLCGKVDRSHPLREMLLSSGIAEATLEAFVDAPCPPDIIGVNHYLTSERYLDEHLDQYPEEFHGGNGCHDYADVEAVRVELPDGKTGPEARLREAWARYHLPLAVTEVHHGCTRDEQVRWLLEVWKAASQLNAEGADLRAVTIWSLFGAKDWNTLLTRRNGFYEPGAFDVRGGQPRPTALARVAAELASKGKYDHPVLDTPGWWRREDRYYMPPPAKGAQLRNCRPLLISGATGTLGRAVARLCKHRGLEHVLLSRAEMDIADPDSVRAAIEQYRPWALVNAAGYVRVADADREEAACMRQNALGAGCLAEMCKRYSLALVTFSSDLVFDGKSGRPYVELDQTSPVCTYGRSKAEAEARVLNRYPDALVIRTSAFFGPWDTYNFVHRTLSHLKAERPLKLSASEIVSPTYVPDLASAALDLLVDAESGIWHLANEGSRSWFDFACELAEREHLPVRMLVPAQSCPRNTTLTSRRGRLMPSLEDALSRFFKDRDASEPMRE
jgi:dTDP-4-dehydrorhamnose reductase